MNATCLIGGLLVACGGAAACDEPVLPDSPADHPATIVVGSFAPAAGVLGAAWQPEGGGDGAAAAKPDPMDAIVDPASKAERIAEGMKFTEGPVWVPGMGGQGGYLLFSDIPENTIFKLAPGADGKWAGVKAEVYRKPSGMANGVTVDEAGWVYVAEHDGRISRTKLDGKVEVLADKFEGKSLNSPNDLCVASDDSVYFTDPPYGLRPPLGSAGRKKELDFAGVYRISADGKLSVISKDLPTPNGAALSPDEKKLYVADTGKGEIRVFNLNADGTADSGALFAEMKRDDGRTLGADGVRVDVKGNVYCAGAGGAHVFGPDGKKIGVIQTDPGPTNLCFGGADYKTLFLTTRSGVHMVPVKIAGNRPK